MKQKYIFSIVFCGIALIIWSSAKAALLPSIFEEKGGSVIQTATGAVGDYSIQNPWDIKESVGSYIYNGRKILAGANGKAKAGLEQKQEAALAFQEKGGVQNIFHQSINCLLNDAMSSSITSINESVTNEYLESGQTKELDLLKPEQGNTSCGVDGVSLETMLAKQERLREQKGLPKTVCPNPDDMTSYCRVSEILLTELQGYSLYLNIKGYHDKSINNGALAFAPLPPRQAATGLAQFIPRIPFIATANAQVGNGQIFSNYNFARNERIQEIRSAIPQSQKSVMNALDLYRQHEESYQDYARYKAIQTNINTSLEQLTEISSLVDTFPDKFINANSRGRQ